MSTLSYYDTNALTYIEATRYVDMKDLYDRFLSFVRKNGKILDFGCGSGRDSKYFIDHMYDVTAVDGSKEMCKYASLYIDKEVKQIRFEEFNESSQYDGIWACSSLLHLEKLVLKDVLQRLIRALKKEGYIYVSFKYGKEEGYQGERFFINFKEDSFSHFIKEIDNLNIIQMWITNDKRKDKSQELWLNAILKKVEL